MNNYYGICIGEWSVPDPTSVSVDGSSTNTGSGTSVTTGIVIVSGPGELVIAGFGQGTGVATDYAVGGSFAMREKQLNGFTQEGCGLASDENAGASEGATFTVSGVSGAWVAIGVSFITSSAAPGFPATLFRKARRFFLRVKHPSFEPFLMRYRPFPIPMPQPIPVVQRRFVSRAGQNGRRSAVAAIVAAPPVMIPLRSPPRQILRTAGIPRRNPGRALFSSASNTTTVLVTSPRTVR